MHVMKNEHNYRITDDFKKIDKLSVLLNYTSMLLPLLTFTRACQQMRNKFLMPLFLELQRQCVFHSY